MFPHTGNGGYVPCEQINRGYVPDRVFANRRGYELVVSLTRATSRRYACFAGNELRLTARELTLRVMNCAAHMNCPGDSVVKPKLAQACAKLPNKASDEIWNTLVPNSNMVSAEAFLSIGFSHHR